MINQSIIAIKNGISSKIPSAKATIASRIPKRRAIHCKYCKNYLYQNVITTGALPNELIVAVTFCI